MGDDAEYYIEQQEEESMYQELARRSREDEMTKVRIKREKKIEAEKQKSSNKK